MTSSLAGIKQQSKEMFDGPLHAEIVKSIDAEMAAEAHPPGSLGPESIATFFAGDRLYEKTKSGSFEGLPHVIWNGLLTDSTKPGFIYRPDPANPFRFTRHNGQVIEPRLMDTDGGSIPKILHSIGRFDPWGYAPGYMIHDWIFIAHQCGHAPDDAIGFDDSATILAECIKTLMTTGFTNFDGQTVKMKKREDTMYLIYKAVSSFIAKGIWDTPGNPSCR